MKLAKRPKIRPSRALVAAALVLLGSYALYQARDLIRGPELTLNTPADGASQAAGLLTVDGQAERIAHLYLNGRLIFTNESGHFNEKLLLPPGYTIIRLEADDKFGRQVNQTIHLYGQKN
jgi:hypothetical protein